MNDILAGILEQSCAQQARYNGNIDSDIDADTPVANIARIGLQYAVGCTKGMLVTFRPLRIGDKSPFF